MVEAETEEGKGPAEGGLGEKRGDHSEKNGRGEHLHTYMYASST
jgi:hypothetical protein